MGATNPVVRGTRSLLSQAQAEPDLASLALFAISALDALDADEIDRVVRQTSERYAFLRDVMKFWLQTDSERSITERDVQAALGDERGRFLERAVTAAHDPEHRESLRRALQRAA